MEKKIRVLIVGSDSSVKGGITTVIDSFFKYNWNDNIKIELLPTFIEGNAYKKLSFFLKNLIIFIKKLIKNECDIVHIHMSYNGSFYRKLIILNIAKLFKKKVIIHLHGSEFEVFYNKSNTIVKKMIKKLFEKSDTTIVLGEKWKNIIDKIAPKSKVLIFNNAISIPEYSAKWNDNKINILFLGVLIKRKGIYELIEAIKCLDEIGWIKEKSLNFIIGGSGKEEEEVINIIDKYDLNYCIDMKGWIKGEDKNNLLEKSLVFILPSYNEGLPMAILEAMSYGIPVISTNVGSISEVVINDKTGYLINPGNVEEIVNSIKDITNDKVEWEKKSICAKKLIVEKFNEAEYFNRIKKLYYTL